MAVTEDVLQKMVALMGAGGGAGTSAAAVVPIGELGRRKRRRRRKCSVGQTAAAMNERKLILRMCHASFQRDDAARVQWSLKDIGGGGGGGGDGGGGGGGGGANRADSADSHCRPPYDHERGTRFKKLQRHSAIALGP
jgi:hypothetical protein